MPDTIILSLNDQVVGRLLSTDAKSLPRVKTGLGPNHSQTTSSVDPATLICGAYHSSQVMFWAGATLKHSMVRRNATLTAVDQAKKTATVAEMFDCLVSEIALPALDRDSKADAAMRLKIDPERMRIRTTVTDTRTALSAPAPKAWKVSDFEFEIDGVRDSQYAQTISSLVVKQGIKKHYSGKNRFPDLEPTKITLDNIVVTIPIEYANDFLKWHEQTQQRQDRFDPQNGHGGELRYLARDKSLVCAVEFNQLSILSILVARPNLRVELYYEYPKLTSGSGLES